jgi:DNA-binding MarR family transcriptional regulator
MDSEPVEVPPPAPAARRFDSLEQEAYLTLWRTYDRLRAIEEEFFSCWELTAQQYNLLRLLQAALPEAVPTLKLVSRLISRAPDVTRMLDKLEARNLIERIRSTDDRRAVLIRLTPAGAKLLETMARPLLEYHQRQLGHLDEKELTELTGLLHRARKPHEPPGSPWK